MAYAYPPLAKPIFDHFRGMQKRLIYQPFAKYSGISTLMTRLLGSQNYDYGMCLEVVL